MASSSYTTNNHEQISADTSNDAHSIKRRFIGPLLESDVSKVVSAINIPFDTVDSDPENATGLTRFIYQNAKEFFLRRGGREEDWGEALESSEGELVLTKWLASEWGRIYRAVRRKKEKSLSSKGLFMSEPYLQPWTNFNWVGSSFEVGDFMGVNVLTKTLSRSPRSQRTQSTNLSISRTLSKFSDVSGPSSHPPSPSPLPSSMRAAQKAPLLSVSAASKASSYVTAQSYNSPANQEDNFLKPPSTEELDDLYISSEDSAISNTPLLPSAPPRSELHVPPERLNPGSSSSKVKQPRSVYFSIPESPRARSKRNIEEIGADTDVDVDDTNEIVEPAPPNEVLARAGSEIEGASAGATVDGSRISSDRHNDENGATVLRDRMLVRISLAVKGNVSRYFTEQESRSAQGLIFRDLAEFLVIFREQQVELYNDYKLPFKERILDHKRLVHTIPLLPTTTQLSLFSFVDYSFCLVYTPRSSRKSQKQAQRLIPIFFTRVDMSYIFIFRPKSRSRAVDWMWRLWSALDGKLPKSMLIHNPLLGDSLRIPIPSFSSDNTNSYDKFAKDTLINTCLQMLKSSPLWENILSLPIMKGKTFELCWRTGPKLDWVWMERDEDGMRRDWAVLFGLTLKIPRQPIFLELRVAEHYYNHVILRDGSYFLEPPSIEGYVYRIGTNNSKSLLYLTTHDNYLFQLRPSRAHPPEPPGIAAAAVGAGLDGDTNIVAENKQTTELTRGRRQILDSDSFLDLRDIISVRRALQPIEGVEEVELVHTHLGRSRYSVLKDLERIFQVREAETEVDGDDNGGDEFLSKTTDKNALRMRRMFELVLLSGHIIKLEVHSCKDAIEWVNRLRQLIFYWTLRYRDDVEVEMEIVRTSEGGESLNRIIKRLQKPIAPPPPPDPAESSHLVGRFWNWCVLEGCRPVVKSGPLYVKTKFRAQYQYSQLFLLYDKLVEFHLTRHRRKRHRRIEIISLLDMYVSSGHYAALSLPSEEYRPGVPPVSKFYRDGLETSDVFEDTFFALWYRSDGKSGDGRGEKSKKIPSLSAKKKLLICRARSKLERDMWCWAINCQIEKLTRENVDRERMIREGNLVDIK